MSDARMLRKRLGWAVVVAGMVAWALLWIRPRPLLVDAVTLHKRPMQVTLDEVGETRSRDSFVLTAPVAGRLQAIDLREGDAVQARQLLARLAPLPLSERERAEALARVAAAQAVRREAEHRMDQAMSEWQHAEREQERFQKLTNDGFMSVLALEQSQLRINMTVAALEAARMHVRAAAAEVNLAQAALSVRSSFQSDGSGWLNLRAPMAGRILSIHDRSERVVAVGTPLMRLGDVQQLEAVIALLSTEAVKVREGMTVWVDAWGGKDQLRARVQRVEHFAFTKVSALGIEEKRVNVIADFVEPTPGLGDGFRLKARIVTWEADSVLRVPVSALFRCESAWCVFQIEQGRVYQRQLILGHRNAAEAEVMAGLQPGDVVVRYPGQSLRDSNRVRIR